MSETFDLSHLLPQHLADLRGSGLSDETISLCRFRSETDPFKIMKYLNCKKQTAKDFGPCLCIPFYDADGKYMDYVRIKPDYPRTLSGKDRPNKYESPSKSNNRIYIPPRTRVMLADRSVPLLITEGEKKAAKADQEGFFCIGVTGVWNWQVKRESKAAERILIPDLDAIPWSGRRSIIAFDSDIIEKPDVQFAEYHLSVALADRGADVVVARIPQPAAEVRAAA